MMMKDQILYMDVGLTERAGKTVPSDAKSEKIHRLFTWAEMAALWERKNEEPIKWILFLIYICMRSKEMLTVKKSDVSLEESHII